MKLNWGTGIAIFYVAFMAVMILMVVRASQNSVHLVQKNYYDKDLNYEAFRQSKINAKELKEGIQVKHVRDQQQIVVRFPKTMSDVEGRVTLYRPSNKFQDKLYSIRLNEVNEMYIPAADLTTGLWRIMIDWQSDQKSYYKEERIVI